jgi:predicted glycosyltransferase
MTDIEKAIMELNIRRNEIQDILKNTTDNNKREEYMKEIKDIYRRIIVLNDIKNI